jgi:uncharacterized membrane protein YgcG
MKRLIVLLAVASTLLAPSAALASGVVLKVQKATHLVAIARSPSSVALVHTSARLAVGQRVNLRARRLSNGTLAASSVRVVGRARKVTFRGLLLAKSGSKLVVSAGGAVIALNRGGRTTASATDSGPTPGSTIQVTATVGSTGELDEDGVTTVTPAAPGGQIEGHLTLGTGTITVTSDHMSLMLKVPTGFDLTTFTNGAEVLATFTQGNDGTLTLSALSADANAQEADNSGDQGNDNGGTGAGGGGDNSGGGDNGGGSDNGGGGTGGGD